ncbi:MAG: bifunctional hydroxymethylpyrimidine kinase/phosphomethylpyrimidine kinase [Bacteroidota bacterium]
MHPSTPNHPVALTIAGSDSGGGAGLQADLKAMHAHGVFGMSVVTAITAQNSHAVTAAFDLPTDLVAAQIDAVAEDFAIRAVKTGMLSSSALIDAVADGIERHGLGPVVVDPVMISKSGFALLKPDAVEAVRARMLPLARLVTPNVHEAEALTGHTIRTLDDAQVAATALHAMGPQAVLVKGGHLPLDGDAEFDAVDVLFDGTTFAFFRSPRIDTPHTHGTGCTYASAIAAGLARGFDLATAVGRAKTYLTEAIRQALPLGRGHGPVHHFWHLDPAHAARPVRGE